MGDAWLIVGLGNPRPGDAGNRHNVGQMAAAEIADRASARFTSHRTNASVAEGRFAPGGPKLVLAKPNTFMNVSGAPVAALMRFYSVAIDHLIVLHDELDIPFDSLRLKFGGGHGGHNGVRDVIAAVGSPDFVRIRIGVGRPPGRQPAADFVLHDFNTSERRVLPNLLSDVADGAETTINEGLTAAQLKFHTARS